MGSRRTPAPRDVSIQSAATREYVPLWGKRAFADMMKLGNLRWGDHPGLFGWARWYLRAPYECKEEVRARESGYKLRNAGGFWMLEESGKQSLP